MIASASAIGPTYQSGLTSTLGSVSSVVPAAGTVLLASVGEWRLFFTILHVAFTWSVPFAG